MALNGFVKIFRQLMEWEWYQDVPVKTLFLHCLLEANFKDKKCRGVELKRGQFLTSNDKLRIKTGLTLQQVRTAIKKLKSTGEITTKSTNRNTIITVVNYDFFQDKNEVATDETTDETTDEQQTDNKQITNNQQLLKNDKNVKNDKKYICAFFEQLWSLYPVKKGKGSISDTQKQKLFKIGIDELTRAINRYIDEQKELGTDIKYYKHGSTFFNSGYVDYLDENYKPLPKTKKGNNNFEERQDTDFDEIEMQALKRRIGNG